MRKTKIICTLGPASRNEKTIREMLKNGMNIARVNFSHDKHEVHQKGIELFRRVRDELKLPAAIMLDTKGPEVRTGDFAGGKVTLVKGQQFTLTIEDIMGDENRVSVTYKELPSQLSIGNMVLVDDGRLRLEVEELTETDIVCRVLVGGTISDHRGINIPNVHLDMPYLSEQDEKDIRFGIEMDVDYIAASFVRTAHDVEVIRELLNKNGGRDIKIIAKIESTQGVENFEEILQAADGIMARLA